MPYKDPKRKQVSDAAYRKANLEKCRAADAAWRKKNLEKDRASSTVWRVANLERSRASGVAWRKENPKKAKRGLIAWRKANPEKVRAYWTAHHALKLHAEGTATAEQIAARWAMWGGMCWMGCGCPATCTDHYKPLTKGGTNWPGNLRPACGPCNCSKGNKWPYEVVV